MFKWMKQKPKSQGEDGYRIKMESIALKEAIARKILGEERRKCDVSFNGYDRRFGSV